MSRLIALEWNDEEARVVVGSSRGERVTFEQAFCVPLGDDSAGLPSPAGGAKEAAPDGAALGKRLAAALAAKRLGRLDALVAVGRTNIELRRLALPPMPDAELPEAVRFQAMRDFNTLDDDWALDYLPLEGSAEEPWSVLAAAIDPESLDQARAVCSAAGLRSRRLVLRPCAAASLFARCTVIEAGQARLLVDLVGNEVDLTVLDGGTVVFLRTTRLSGDPLTGDEHAEGLIAQLRRTVAAAQSQIGRRIEAVVVFGSEEAHATLAAQIRERMALAVEVFNPLASLNLEADLARNLPEQPARFAPLLGMLLDEASAAPHAIDFFNPRRTPPPPSRRRQWLMAGAAAAVLAAVTAAVVTQYGNSLRGDVERLAQELQDLQRRETAVNEMARDAEVIGRWADVEVLWLGELARLARDFPPAEEAMLTQLNTGPTDRGGEMRLDVLARDPGTITTMARNLRGEGYRVEVRQGSQDSSQSPYAWRYNASWFIDRKAPE